MPRNFKNDVKEAHNSGKLAELLNNSTTLGQVCIGIGYSDHGRNTKYLNEYLALNEIAFGTYTGCGRKQTKELRNCAQCNKEFEAITSQKMTNKQITCSNYCSNNYKKFKEDRLNNRLFAEESYRVAARNAGMHSCCICGESEVLDIHHIDEDRDNNSVSNLMPLCPTHHMYIHRGKSHLIFDKMVEYLDNR